MGVWELGEKGEGIEKYRLVFTMYGDIKYSIGHTVNNTVICMNGAN